MVFKTYLGDGPIYYDGSQIFMWLAQKLDVSVDIINLLVCQMLALFVASLFRSYLHKTKVTTSIRYAVSLAFGLCMAYFCYGIPTIHIIGLPSICYIIIRTQNPEIVHYLVLCASMGYLSMFHLYRVFFLYQSYVLDIGGPLMIITQKVTLLAFSIHDGFTRKEKDLTKAQKNHAIAALPGTLEYFSYILHFQGVMVGPMVFYNDYIEFIEGSQFLKHNINSNGDRTFFEPSPISEVVKKVLASLISGYILLKGTHLYPMNQLMDDDFIDNVSFGYKMWYIMMATAVTRFKYYHAWLLSEAIYNNSGLGFNGYKTDGTSRWDRITNVKVLTFESATNMREAISNWNISTNYWLRFIVYERVPKKYGTIVTFLFSAIWHGFYPGYFISFVSTALIVTAARTARNLFRHRFQKNETTQIVYDILTMLTTRIFIGYVTFPFILREFKASARLYMSLYMSLHLVSVITICILPQYISTEFEPATIESNNLDTVSESSATSQSDGVYLEVQKLFFALSKIAQQ